MFLVGEAVVDEEIPRAGFCCDVRTCKGACCTLEGGRGAPLEEKETREIKKLLPIVRQYLPERSLRIIDEKGHVEGTPGNHATPCVDDRECVYVYFDDGIARCSFERAFLEGLSSWRKPLSCHLFPIRVRNFGQDFVTYHEIDECAAGRLRGTNEQVKLRDFLEEPLVRKYGRRWYDSFLEECRLRDGRPDPKQGAST